MKYQSSHTEFIPIISSNIEDRDQLPRLRGDHQGSLLHSQQPESRLRERLQGEPGVREGKNISNILRKILVPAGSVVELWMGRYCEYQTSWFFTRTVLHARCVLQIVILILILETI